MKSVFLKSFSNQTHCLTIPNSDEFGSADSLYEKISELFGIPFEEQLLSHNGKILNNTSSLQCLSSGSTIDISLRLQGGKGGFGSLLRGQAVSKRKITNFDASRDLQGRRIRNVKYLQKAKEWAKKKADEDKVVKQEVDEYNKAQKEIQGVQRDVKLAQEFKDKVEKWDHEMSKSISKGAKRTKNNSRTHKSSQLTDSDILGDFEVPLKKKVATEKMKIEVDLERVDGELDAKISSKLALIMREEDSQDGKVEEIIEKKVELIEIGNEEVVEKKNGKNGHSTEKGKKEEKKEEQTFPEIDLKTINTVEELVNLGGDHLKHELMRLGLKCGGSVQDRAKRLFDIKLKPELLLNPKYIAKK